MKNLALASKVVPRGLWAILWILKMRGFLYPKYEFQIVMYIVVIRHLVTCFNFISKSKHPWIFR